MTSSEEVYSENNIVHAGSHSHQLASLTHSHFIRPHQHDRLLVGYLAKLSTISRKCTSASNLIIKLDFAAAMFYFDVRFCYYRSVKVVYVCCNVL